MLPSQTKATKHSYYERNKERIKARVREYQRNNKKKISQRLKRQRISDPVFFKKRAHRYYLKHREKRRETYRSYHLKNRKRILKYMRALYRKNRKSRLKKQTAYTRAHKKQIIAYSKTRYWSNPKKWRKLSLKYRKKNIKKVRAWDRKRSKVRYRTKEYKEWSKKWLDKNRDKVRARHSTYRNKAIELLGGKCARCGYKDNYSVIEIDHKISFLERGVNRPNTGGGFFFEVFKKPSKFQALCANCHSIKTSLELRGKNTKITADKIQYQRKRDLALSNFGCKCLRCGYKENKSALEFDHKKAFCRPKKAQALGDALKRPHLIQLLCSNCHRLKTLEDFAELRRRRKEQRAS